MNITYPDGVKLNASDIRYCPKCNADFKGQPIPEEYRKKGYYGDDPPTHYLRIIGIEDPEVYDGVICWMCPDCKHRWERFNNDQF